jgi:hypothetical protein
MSNIKNTETTALFWHVQTLVWEQEQKIEATNPTKKATYRKLGGFPEWYPLNLQFIKEILPKFQPTTKEDYEIKIIDLKQEMYEHANGAHKPALMWTAKLEVYDKKNTWRELPIEKTGAMFDTKEKTLKCLNDNANKMIGYDMQHIRELIGFQQGKTAICSCGKPVNLQCDNDFHECETGRQGGYTFN